MGNAVKVSGRSCLCHGLFQVRTPEGGGRFRVTPAAARGGFVLQTLRTAHKASCNQLVQTAFVMDVLE